MSDLSPVGRTDEAPGHPGLSIKIYTVDSKTLQRGPAVSFTLPPAKGPMESSVFPECECPRCRARPGRAR